MKYILMILTVFFVNGLFNSDTLANTCGRNCSREVTRPVATATVGAAKVVAKVGVAACKLPVKAVKAVGVCACKLGRAGAVGVYRVGRGATRVGDNCNCTDCNCARSGYLFPRLHVR